MGGFILHRKISDFKNKKIKNVKCVRVVDSKTLNIELESGYVIKLRSTPTDYGYDSYIYIEK